MGIANPGHHMVKVSIFESKSKVKQKLSFFPENQQKHIKELDIVQCWIQAETQVLTLSFSCLNE